ncbi:hypothetical protein SPRG_17394 [Saprolegnia parasitica CBS 223.65]|uniref:Uncharacterized protein n=1 Tax=Saprolegnia parasitica (strain CBS 223.65) TaxID=695850 RepID=A0A067BGG3_SAPPC|nr:hypothetical protein SPRG_17394 [Saprolegnia parasitica CBS 223.65]KDO17203.1 hypothetical protein SPRG_17394 [Saprolegnia parasitica CBS 223.65]|eukprot:XP_012212088.1 hypothetical protein SPRG_17394 [Saprolegnia parasitica CBS 223.65]
MTSSCLYTAPSRDCWQRHATILLVANFSLSPAITEVAPAPLASPLTSIAESGEVFIAPTHNLMAVAWRRLLSAADTMRLLCITASDSFVLYASLLTGLFFAPKTAQDDTTALELSRHMTTI